MVTPWAFRHILAPIAGHIRSAGRQGLHSTVRPVFRSQLLLRGAGYEASFPSAGTQGRAGGGNDAQFEITRYQCGDAAGGADHAAVEGRQANQGIEFVAYRFTLERYRSFKTSPDQVILARKNRRHLPQFVRAMNER